MSSIFVSNVYLHSAYLRVAALAVGLYELVRTLPAEFHFYRAQKSFRNISQQCVLFILLRYFSVLVVVVSNVGFFHTFSKDGCRHFLLVSPVVKVLQTMISQAILGVRTYNISRKARWVKYTMVVAFLLVVPLEFFSNLYKRIPTSDSELHNCTSGNPPDHRVAWIHYFVAMGFDVVAILISTAYLWTYKATTSRLSHFVSTLLYEGLGYFVILTSVNVFNLVLYRSVDTSIQSSGATLGYVIIWIMSQRILVKQREAAEKYAEDTMLTTTTQKRTYKLDSSRDINNALRSHFEVEKTRSMFSEGFLSSPTRSMTAARHHQLPRIDSTMNEEFSVEVHVEQSVTRTVQYDPDAFERENYRTPRVMWDTISSSR